MQALQPLRRQTRSVGVPAPPFVAPLLTARSHCPWVFNCIGIANHRQFFLYILTLELGIFLLVRLVLLHAQLLPPLATPPTCAVFSEMLCAPLWQDPFTFYIGFWAALQATWVTMLLCVQFIQIAKAQTTYESMTASKHHGHHPHGERDKITTALTTAIAAGSTSTAGAALDPSARGPEPAASIASSRTDEGWWRKAKKLLGVDVFWQTAGGGQHTRREKNPFSAGIVRNCKDFWGAASPAWRPPLEGGLGAEGELAGKRINYANIYETPRMRGGTWDTAEGEV